MRTLFFLLTCAILNSCAGTESASSARAPTKPLDSQEQAYIAQIEADGRLMYEKDIRAARASDLVLSAIDPSDFPNFVGWVTYPNEGGDFTVSFYERANGAFSIIADVIYSNREQSSLELTPSRPMSAEETSMIKARISALKNSKGPCSARHNTIIVPAPGGAIWDVYVMAATTDPNLIQIGGHTMVRISRQTSEVVTTRRLSNSCLTLNKSGGDFPEGTAIAAYYVSHVVTTMPIPVHTYTRLLHEASLAVSSKRGVWMIEAGKVRPL